jgi:hypothetical protein
MVSGLLDQLQRIFPLAAKLDEEIVQEETEILKNTIPRMFEVIQQVSKCSCEYVKREYFGGQHVSVLEMLTIAGKTEGGSVHQQGIEEMEQELTRVVEDFDRAVNVDALRLAKDTGKRRLSQSDAGSFLVVSCRANPFTWAA